MSHSQSTNQRAAHIIIYVLVSEGGFVCGRRGERAHARMLGTIRIATMINDVNHHSALWNAGQRECGIWCGAEELKRCRYDVIREGEPR